MLQSKRLRLTLTVLIVVVAGSLLVRRALQVMPKSVQGQSVSSSTPCDTMKMLRLFEKMKVAEILYKVEWSAGKPEIYVGATWYALPIDGKEKLDGALQCYFTGIIGERMRLPYYDYRSGKRVAISSVDGLSID